MLCHARDSFSARPSAVLLTLLIRRSNITGRSHVTEEQLYGEERRRGVVRCGAFVCWVSRLPLQFAKIRYTKVCISSVMRGSTRRSRRRLLFFFSSFPSPLYSRLAKFESQCAGSHGMS